METRDKIIDVTFNAFLIEGFNNISLNDLIKRTGLTKGAFYHHFENKNELMEAVVDRYFISYVDGYANNLEKMDGNALDKLHSLTGGIELMIKTVLPDHKEVSPEAFLSLLMSATYLNPILKEKEKQSSERIKTLLVNLIKQGKEEGLIRISLPPEELARLISLSLKGTLFEWTMNPQGLLKDSLMKTVKSITGLLG